MKRITLLALLAVGLMVVAIPAMAASTFAWSGEITSAFQTDFTTSSEAVSTANVTLGVTINDNLSFTGLIIATTNAAAGSTGGSLTNANGAYDATMQLGKILNLGIGEAVTIGNFAPGATTYAVSVIANEGVFGAAMTAGNVSIQSVTTVSGINVQLAFDPGSFFGGTAAYLADVYGAFGPVQVSLGYGSNQTQGLDVQFAQSMGDLGFAVDVQEGYSMATGGGLKIGFGAKVTYTTLLTFGIGTNYAASGATTGLGNLGINVNLAPSATMGVDLYANMSGTFTIAYVDASFWTKVDASTLRLGYVYTSSTGGYNVARLLNGGLYFTWDVTF